jgi:hypothetical protein
MSNQAKQYEPEDPHYVTQTDERGKQRRTIVCSHSLHYLDPENDPADSVETGSTWIKQEG